jgi:hypothetical protein
MSVHWRWSHAHRARCCSRLSDSCARAALSVAASWSSPPQWAVRASVVRVAFTGNTAEANPATHSAHHPRERFTGDALFLNCLKRLQQPQVPCNAATSTLSAMVIFCLCFGICFLLTFLFFRRSQHFFLFRSQPLDFCGCRRDRITIQSAGLAPLGWSTGGCRVVVGRTERSVECLKVKTLLSSFSIFLAFVVDYGTRRDEDSSEPGKANRYLR